MLLEPSVIVLYVDNVAKTSQFYQDILGIHPEESSATFHSFALSNGMHLALKAKHTVMPLPEAKSGNGELAFTLESNEKVDALFAEWQTKGVNLISPPDTLPFGYTFVGVDPDGHRLRVVSIGNR